MATKILGVDDQIIGIEDKDLGKDLDGDLVTARAVYNKIIKPASQPIFEFLLGDNYATRWNDQDSYARFKEVEKKFYKTLMDWSNNNEDTPFIIVSLSKKEENPFPEKNYYDIPEIRRVTLSGSYGLILKEGVTRVSKIDIPEIKELIEKGVGNSVIHNVQESKAA